MRTRINLDTQSKIIKFVDICMKENYNVYLTDGNNYTVSAKSVLGCFLARAEWTEIWCESEHDIYTKIKEFVIE